MVYRAVKGSIISDEQAVKYGKELAEIEKEKGSITKEIVVEKASNELSPLHDFFEWDNTEAARRYRLRQAGDLIRSIEVIVYEATPPIRAFMSVTIDSSKAYHSQDVVFSNPDLQKQIIDEALKNIKMWKAKYSQYKNWDKILDEAIKILAGENE